MSFEWKKLPEIKKSFGNQKRAHKDLDRRAREEAYARKQRLDSLPGFHVSSEKEVRISPDVEIRDKCHVSSKEGLIFSSEVHDKRREIMEPEYASKSDARRSNDSSISKRLADQAEFLKDLNKKNPHLAKRLETQAKQEIKDQMEITITRWDNARQRFDKTIEEGDRLLEIVKQLDLAKKSKVIVPEGEKAHNEAMGGYQEIYGEEASDFLQNKEKMAVLGKHIDDCHRNAKQLEKLTKKRQFAINEAKEKEENTRKLFSSELDYERSQKCRIWMNKIGRDIENYSTPLKELDAEFEELCKERDRLEKYLKSTPNNDCEAALEALNKKYREIVQGMDQEYNRVIKKLHKTRDEAARKYDRDIRGFGKNATAGNYIFDLKIVVGNLVQVLDSEWYQKVSNLENEMLNAWNYAWSVAGNNPSLLSSLFYSKEAVFIAWDKTHDIIQEALQSLKEGSSFNELKEMHAQYYKGARWLAERYNPEQVAEFSIDQEISMTVPPQRDVN